MHGRPRPTIEGVLASHRLEDTLEKELLLRTLKSSRELALHAGLAQVGRQILEES